ncbi:MAG: BatA domain-containing protein [Planctomycetes bacterium]|nr:BatA domain-containing protein [Planctomycetota bacterium]
MFSFLNPLFLWGLAAISLPIIIHLLLRQRPKPRPWAAMDWLQAALHAAQRKYKITNFLLLLMRCIIIALISLAISRPHLGIWQQGGDLVLIIDVSASMGSNSHGNGALESAKKVLQEQKFTQDRVCVVSVGHEIHVLSDSSADSALRSLEQLKADNLPGGLSRLLEDDKLNKINPLLKAHSTVLCISDFRQDDGSTLVKTLATSVHSINRWQVGANADNTFVSDLPQLPDFVAGQAQHVRLQLQGPATDIHMSIDDGSASPIPLQDPLMVSLPPLQTGVHRLKISFADQGLDYDNIIEFGIHVRGPVPCLIVQQNFGYLAAATSAAHQQLDYTHVDPARLHSEPLVDNGIVVVDAAIGYQQRLWKWIEKGGVAFMWSEHFFAESKHQEYCNAITSTNTEVDGFISCGDVEFDRVMSKLPFEKMIHLQLTEHAESMLSIEGSSLIARSKVGDGYIIVASSSLRNNDLFWTQGIVPFFWRNILRDTSAHAQLPLIIEAGSPAHKDLLLIDHQQEEHAFAQGETVMLLPGVMRQKNNDKQVIILPHSSEGILQLPDHQEIARELQKALPQNIGADWTLWALIALILLVMAESLFAGHAGRKYGN